MKLALLTALTMVAFAANSVLNRLAVDGQFIDPSSFAVVRVSAGALVLYVLVRGRVQLWVKQRAVGAISLAIYLIGFSLAYATLDAGLGALILFGTVQVTMFGWSAFRGAQTRRSQIIGAGVAFGGLALALWPNGETEIAGAGLMLAAGIGWAAYSLVGRQETDPTAATAGNFVVASPIVMALLLVGELHISLTGVALAILSGAVTSGLGYAAWYSIVRRIESQTAAVVQLSVPIIAIVAGATLLGEAVGAVLILSAALVLGGIAIAIRAQP